MTDHMTDLRSFTNSPVRYIGTAKNLYFGTDGQRGSVSDMIGLPGRRNRLRFDSPNGGDLGADVITLGRSEKFIAVDTEAHDPQLIDLVSSASNGRDRHGSEAFLAWGLKAATIGLKSVHIGQQ